MSPAGIPPPTARTRPASAEPAPPGTTGPPESLGQEFDLSLPAGRLHGSRSGGSRRTVLCLPGLSANLRGFDAIAGRLAAHSFEVIALDLRGRGKSEATAPGSYGWPAHAADVAEVAQRLATGPVAVIGWSMGAFVSLQLADLRPRLLDRVVLLDACGPTGAAATALIQLAVDRLGVVHPSVEAYLEAVKSIGTVTPWDPLWEGYFRYELEPVTGGFRARTRREAVIEDFEYGRSHDPRTLWPALTMPALLVRAARPLVPGGPFIVSDEDRAAFGRTVPKASVVEVDANHYGLVTHPATAEAIVAFLEEPVDERGRSDHGP